jgi:hypothetical protein
MGQNVGSNRVRTPGDLRSRLMLLCIEPAAFLMTGKILLGINRRTEMMAQTERRAA